VNWLAGACGYELVAVGWVCGPVVGMGLVDSEARRIGYFDAPAKVG
jgi:hypothetical protein